jgi:adenylosuccinate synthase
MFSQANRTVVVVGAQWGDEGKGKLVDVLAERADWVVRYQGGANAGHTVDLGDVGFVLHQIPSGILHEGVRCAIGNGVVLDPDTLFNEIDGLVRDGIDVEGRLYVSDRAHLVLPYHKLLDAESPHTQSLGTTGRGIGPTYEDKVARRGVRVLDLRNLPRLRELVGAGVQHANMQLAALGSAKRADAEQTVALLERLAERLLPLADDVGLMIYRAMKSGAAVLLEGAQGSLLDVDHGTYPFVTSSSTTSGGAAIGVGIPPTAIDAVLGVVKAYTTRVGTGPFPTEMDEPMAERVRKLGDDGSRASLRLVRRDRRALRDADQRPDRCRCDQARRARHARSDCRMHRLRARWRRAHRLSGGHHGARPRDAALRVDRRLAALDRRGAKARRSAAGGEAVY